MYICTTHIRHMYHISPCKLQLTKHLPAPHVPQHKGPKVLLSGRQGFLFEIRASFLLLPWKEHGDFGSKKWWLPEHIISITHYGLLAWYYIYILLYGISAKVHIKCGGYHLVGHVTSCWIGRGCSVCSMCQIPPIPPYYSVAWGWSPILSACQILSNDIFDIYLFNGRKKNTKNI